jgi:hypothetical protein
MRPPPIYPQLPHLQNLGLAMLVCITPLQNVCPSASILKPFEKKFFEEVIFSSNIIKTPKSSRDGGKNAQRVSSNEGEVNNLGGERHLNIKKSFLR